MDPTQTPLSYSDIPPGSRLTYEVLPDGIRIECLGWCQGRTIGRIFARLLRMTLLMIAMSLAVAAMWMLVLRRIALGVPLVPMLRSMIEPNDICGYLVPIVSSFAAALVFGNIRLVIEADREKLTSTTQFFRFRSSQELPRSAIESIQAKREMLIVKTKRGHRNIRLKCDDKAQALWLARTLRHALALPTEA
ncbi:MAG: hypothetical protein ACM359_12305 [Bacillota bacterium]